MENGSGIQELMAAETRASQIVAEARIGEFCVGVDRRERGFFSSLSIGILLSFWSGLLCRDSVLPSRDRLLAESCDHDDDGSNGLSCFAGRGDRMKQAKVEAQGLVNTYRNEKQEEFNNMVLSKGGSEGSASAKLQSDTNAEIQAMQTLFQRNAQKAVDVLLSKCCEVSLEVPTARVRSTQKAAGITA